MSNHTCICVFIFFGAFISCFTTVFTSRLSFWFRIRKYAQQEREAKINGLSDKSIQVLCSCDVVSEGTDIPAVSVGILLRRTQSLSLHLQQLGRCLRPAGNKENAIILDHVGNLFQHGFAEDEREWTLDGEMISKRKKDKIPQISICNECFAAFKSSYCICPYCGITKIVETPDIEVDNNAKLVEISKHEVRERRIQAREAWDAATNWRQLFLVAERFGLPKKDVFFEGKRRGYAFKRKQIA